LTSEPNVLFIVTDDQRSTGTLEVMPHTVKWFKDAGTHFPDAVATTPVCGPSRASIFTGRYGHNHEVLHNYQAPNVDQRFTLQRYLKEAGYRTGIFGKYLNDWDLTIDPPHFESWAIFNVGYRWIEAREYGSVQTVERYSTTWVADHTVDFLRKGVDDKRPWFCYVAPFAPHPPPRPDSEYENAAVPPFEPTPNFLEADRSDKPPHVQEIEPDPEAILADRVAQLRTLYSVDDLVRRVMETIEELGQGEDTLAFFMSDNGWMWGEHGLDAKTKPYTASIQIPMLLRWPGRVAEGETIRGFAANIDMAPTAVEAVGLSPEIPMDGRSLLGGRARNRVLLEFWGGPARAVPRGLRSPWASTRTHSYQYVEYYEPGSWSSPTTFREYYDLESDPWQLSNLLADGNTSDQPDVERLSAELGADKACGSEDCP
jgi:arylsulfatase A-like enzyme